MNLLRKVLYRTTIFGQWLIALIMVFSTFAMLNANSYPAAGIIFFVGLIAVPQVREFCYKVTGLKVSASQKWIAGVLLFLVAAFVNGTGQAIPGGGTSPPNVKSNPPKSDIQNALERNADSFANVRSDVIKELDQLITSSQWQQASMLTIKYSLVKGDPALDELRDRMAKHKRKATNERRTIAILDQLKSIPVIQYNDNRELYLELVKLNPQNHEYANKLKFYGEQILELERKVVAEKAKQDRKIAYAGPPPRRTISLGRNFEYIEVKQYLRSIAHDPDSVELHKCTKTYFNEKVGWLVACEYFGKNAFGAKVRNSNWFAIRFHSVVKVFKPDAFSF